MAHPNPRRDSPRARRPRPPGRRWSRIGPAAACLAMGLAVGSPAWAAGSAHPPVPLSAANPEPAAVRLRLGSPEIDQTVFFALTRKFYGDLEKTLGWSIELVPLPGMRSLVESNAGRLDGEAGRIALMSEKGKFPNLLRVPVALLNLHLAAYSLDSSLRISGWDELRSGRHRIAIPTGYWFVAHRFEGAHGRPWLMEAKDPRHLMRLLMGRRVDLILEMDEVLARASASGLPAGMGGGAWPPVYRVGVIESIDVFPYLHRKHADKIEAFAAALTEQLRRDSALVSFLAPPPHPGRIWEKSSP